MNVKWYRWTVFWGCLDLLYLAIYAAQSLAKGDVPMYHEFVVARQTAVVYGNSFPLILAIFGVAFYLSLSVSGWLLIKMSNWGRYISYAQIVPRLLLAIPSFFPLIYLFRYVAFWMAIALILLSELFKVITFRSSRSGALSALGH